MNRGTWKNHERKAARLFGTLRKPGSGSQGRDDMTKSDSVHGRIFIEQKTRGRSFVRTLMNATAEKAKGEHKVPILALRETGKPGAILCVREQDMDALVIEYTAAHAARLWPQIVETIRANHGVEDPGDILSYEDRPRCKTLDKR